MTQHTWNCDACGIEINWNDESKSQPKHFGIAGNDLRIYCKDCAEKLKSAMRRVDAAVVDYIVSEHSVGGTVQGERKNMEAE